MLTPDDFDDKLLLSKVADGDEHAFRQIFLKYAPFLQSRLNRLINIRSEQEDLVQETFLRVWLHRDQLPDVQNWRAWLLRICYNRAFTHLRQQQTQQKTQRALDAAASLHTIQEGIDLSNLKAVIATVIRNLPPQQRKMYLLNREAGMSIAEISGQLQLSPQTVKNTIGAALKSIRLALERYGYLFWTLPVLMAQNYFTGS